MLQKGLLIMHFKSCGTLMYAWNTTGRDLNSRKCLRGPHQNHPTYAANYIMLLTQIYLCDIMNHV